MSRLTEKNEQGWGVKKMPWSSLHPGSTITLDIWDKLYDIIRKLMEYEDTGLDPDQVSEMDELYLEKCREVNEMKKKMKSGNAGWIPFEERRTDVLEEMETGLDYILTGRLPDDGQEILVSDGVSSWYDTFNDDGCEVYLDSSIDIIGDAMAWMPLPEPYRPARLERADNQTADHADQDTIAPAT